MTNNLDDIDPTDMVDIDMKNRVEELTTNSRYIQINDALSQGDRPFIININGQVVYLSERGGRLLARTIHDTIEEEGL